MEDERTTHYATVRVELEDVTAEIAGEFWSSLYGREIDIGGYVAQIVEVDHDNVPYGKEEPMTTRNASGATDLLSRKIAEAFKVTCEAEKIAAHGPRGKVYEHLLGAHSALLRAKNAR